MDLSIRLASQTMDRVKIILQVVCGDTMFIDIKSAAFQRLILPDTTTFLYLSSKKSYETHHAVLT